MYFQKLNTQYHRDGPKTSEALFYSLLFSFTGLKYTLVSESGEGNARQFTMSVSTDEQTFEGTGRSKKMAKNEAAKYALIKLFNILCIPREYFLFTSLS